MEEKEKDSIRQKSKRQRDNNFVKYAFLLSILLIISLVIMGVYLYAFAPGNSALQGINPAKLLISLLISGLLAIPGIAHNFISMQVNLVIQGSKKQAETAIRWLKKIFWLKDPRFDDIVWAFSDEQEQIHRDILSERYKNLTGKDIEDRLYHLMFE